jgi:histidine triad (HIT) family protein
MLSDEQVQKIKNHLLEQIENFPEEQRKTIKHKLLSMNSEEMEEFLKENNLNPSAESSEESPKCIFCSIAKKEIKSFIISEDKEYLAILEINPVSKGHTLVIPKEHVSVDKVPENSIDFAKKVASTIFSKLSPKDIKFQKNEVLGHGNLEIIPVYDDSKLERKRATENELSELFNLFSPNEKPIEEKKVVVVEEKKEERQVEEKPKEPLPKLKPRIGWI